jgi:hypothetical protein
MAGNEWCHIDLRLDVECPLQIKSDVFNPGLLTDIIGYHANQARYMRRDLDGDLKPETLCNFKAREILRASGVIIPRMLANQYAKWFASEAAKLEGWGIEVFEKARQLVAVGARVVAVAFNPRGHGHIAVGAPPRSAADAMPGKLFVAQAGLLDSSYLPIERAFGGLHFELYSHHP